MEVKEEMKNSPIFLVLLLLLSCTFDDKPLFFVHNEVNANPPISIDNVKHIKHNIYMYNNKLHIAGRYTKKEMVNDAIKTVDIGLYLHKTIDGKSIEELVDIETYEQVLNLFLYKDKNNVYLLQAEEGCHLCLTRLDLNPRHLEILDDNFEYIRDKDTVYCLRNGKKITTKKSKNFITFSMDGSVFGANGEYIYSMCEPIHYNDFINNFDNIPADIKNTINRMSSKS